MGHIIGPAASPGNLAYQNNDNNEDMVYYKNKTATDSHLAADEGQM